MAFDSSTVHYSSIKQFKTLSNLFKVNACEDFPARWGASGGSWWFGQRLWCGLPTASVCESLLVSLGY